MKKYYSFVTLMSTMLFASVTACSLKSCGSKDGTSTEEKNSVNSGQAEQPKRTLNLFTWSFFLDEKRLEDFERATNIHVQLSQYSSNEEMLAKLQSGASGYDLVVPSDYIIPVMVRSGLLAELDKNKLAATFAELDPTYLKKSFDPENKHTIPYSWTTTGITYNQKKLGKDVKSWKDFFAFPELAGKLSLLDDGREVFGLGLRLTGSSINDSSAAALAKAAEKLKELRRRTAMFTSEPLDPLLNDEIWAAQMYSSDGLQVAAKSNGKLKFVLPEEGTIFTIDNLAILATSPHKDEAIEFIKYLLTPESNARTVQERWVGPVVKATRGLLPPDMANNPGLFPPESYHSKMNMLQELDDAGNERIDKAWVEYKMQ